MTVSATASSSSPIPSREPVVALPATAQAPRLAEQVREAAALEREYKVADVTSIQARALLAEVNQSLQMASIGVRFEFDEEARTMITKVVDVQSGEMICQMPNEEVVRVLKMLSQLQGLLASETV